MLIKVNFTAQNTLFKKHFNSLGQAFDCVSKRIISAFKLLRKLLTNLNVTEKF